MLLPGLDPSTMGWKQRAFHLAPDDVALLFDRNGNGGPTAWVDGRIVGGWHQRADGEIALHLTADVGAEARAGAGGAGRGAHGAARRRPLPHPLPGAAAGEAGVAGVSGRTPHSVWRPHTLFDGRV